MEKYTGLYELESGSESMPVALGINESRENELDAILEKCVKGNSTISATFVDLWNNVDHPNEFAYVMFHYGTKMGANKALEGFLGHMLKKG